MNLHQKLKSIEAKRERVLKNPASKIIDEWKSPVEGKVTKRRKLCLKSESNEAYAPLDKRGPLEIGSLNRHGGSDSIVHRSISLQMHRFEKLLDHRINEIKSELASK